MSLGDPNLCPDTIKAALNAYAHDHREAGGFVMSVLENNLREAVARADHINTALLPCIVSYANMRMPHGSWGSPEAVKEWLTPADTLAPTAGDDQC